MLIYFYCIGTQYAHYSNVKLVYYKLVIGIDKNIIYEQLGIIKLIDYLFQNAS